MKRFLHAICGSSDKSKTTRLFAKPEWEEVRMDPNPDFKPDITASLLHMEEVPDASFDAVFTAHSLERLYPHQVSTALANIARVLKADGYLVVSCADIQAACALVAEDKLLEPAYESPAGPVAPIDILYGFRPALAGGLERHACKCGFTSRALMGTLSQGGFASIWAARNAEMFSIVALASKDPRAQPDMQTLAETHFK